MKTDAEKEEEEDEKMVTILVRVYHVTKVPGKMEGERERKPHTFHIKLKNKQEFSMQHI